jgi:hypothetical protein
MDGRSCRARPLSAAFLPRCICYWPHCSLRFSCTAGSTRNSPSFRRFRHVSDEGITASKNSEFLSNISILHTRQTKSGRVSAIPFSWFQEICEYFVSTLFSMPFFDSSVFSSFQSYLTVPGFRAPSFDAFFVEAAFVGVDNEARCFT